jgi:hypothetical protein
LIFCAKKGNMLISPTYRGWGPVMMDEISSAIAFLAWSESNFSMSFNLLSSLSTYVLGAPRLLVLF